MIRIIFDAVEPQDADRIGLMFYDPERGALVVVDRIVGQRTTQLGDLRQTIAVLRHVLSTEFALDTDRIELEMGPMALSLHAQALIQNEFLRMRPEEEPLVCTRSADVRDRRSAGGGGGGAFNIILRS